VGTPPAHCGARSAQDLQARADGGSTASLQRLRIQASEETWGILRGRSRAFQTIKRRRHDHGLPVMGLTGVSRRWGLIICHVVCSSRAASPPSAPWSSSQRATQTADNSINWTHTTSMTLSHPLPGTIPRESGGAREVDRHMFQSLWMLYQFHLHVRAPAGRDRLLPPITARATVSRYPASGIIGSYRSKRTVVVDVRPVGRR
jgi:hypothetical protein